MKEPVPADSSISGLSQVGAAAEARRKVPAPVRIDYGRKNWFFSSNLQLTPTSRTLAESSSSGAVK